jgi:hypothetical protein
LLEILGVLFALNVITENDIQSFFEKFEIVLPKNETWESLWPVLRRDAMALRTSQVAQITPQQSTSSQSRRLQSQYRWLLLFVPLVMIGFGAGALLRSQGTPTSSNTICSEPVAFSAPIFQRDQGFSLFSPSSTNPQSSLLIPNVRSFGTNKDGLWIGYAPQAAGIQAISYYDRDAQSWIHCSGLQLTANQNINDFEFDGDSVYLATDGAGIMVLEDNSWSSFTIDHGLLSNNIYDLWKEGDGSLWAATYEGVAKLVGARWEPMYQAKAGELPSNHVHAYLEDPQGNRWFGLVANGIARLTSENIWETYYTATEGFQNIRAIQVDNQQGIWFATDGGGVLRFYEDAWTEFTTANGLLSNGAQDVAQDFLGRIWVATDGGVSYTADYGKTWKTHSSLNTWALAFGCEGCRDPEYHMWLSLRDLGIGNVRVPPLTETIRITDPPVVKLRPGEEYIFEVEVEVISEQLQESDGDSLRSIEPMTASLYGAHENIPYKGGGVERGQRHIFSNVDDPIIAPEEPGVYQLAWRVWQGRRYASEPVVVQFEVVED